MRRVRASYRACWAAMHGAAVLALAACSVGPDWAVPKTWSPMSWFASGSPRPAVASEPALLPVEPDWWTAFKDPFFTGLVLRVSAKNLDVRAAGFRLAQSRAQRGVSAADQFPKINGDSSYTREKQSGRGVISLVGGNTGTGAGTTDAATGDMPALLSRIAARHSVSVHHVTGHWLDVDTLLDLADARNFK